METLGFALGVDAPEDVLDTGRWYDVAFTLDAGAWVLPDTAVAEVEAVLSLS